VARTKTGKGSVMSEQDALAILKAANFKASEPFHAKMTPWLMECLVCHNIFKRRLRDVINGFGCKYCNGKKWTSENAVKTMLDSGLKPIEPFKDAGSNWAVECLKCGKNSKVALRHIASESIRGCKHCSLDAKQDFDAKEIVIFEKIRDLDFTIIEGERYRGHKKVIRVRCNLCEVEGNFYPGYLTANSGKRVCKTCATNRMSLSLEVVEHRFKLANLKPLEQIKKARQKVRYQCLVCGYEGACSSASISSGRGCFRCGKTRGGLKNRVPYEVVVADFAKFGLKVIGEYLATGIGVESICLTCNKKVKKAHATLMKNQNGCPYCSEDRVDPEDAIESIRRRGFEPVEPFPGGAKPWLCKCKTCGRESKPTHVGKSQKGSGCAYCSKNRVDPAEAIEFMISHQIKPLEPYKGATAKWRCECLKCSREITTMYNTVKNGSGCRFCAIQGMDYDGPAFIYLVVHPELDALKVGIGSQEFRIKQHTSLGWQLVKRWNYKTGFKASEIEERVLGYLRSDLQLSHYLSKEQMPQKGHTETFGLDDISVNEVQRLIEKYSRESIKPVKSK
jgi:hypothetical protein